MTARSLYLTLPFATRCAIDREVLQRAGVDVDAPADAADPLSLDDVLSHEDDPALVAVLRDAWWPTLTTGGIALALDGAVRHRKERELAIVLCAESVAHLTTDPRSIECRRVRLASVRGEASWSARERAIERGHEAARLALNATRASAERGAAIACVDDGLWDAASSVAKATIEPTVARPLPAGALVAALRTLYPDPTRLDYRDALTRWDVAVAQARDAMQVAS